MDRYMISRAKELGAHLVNTNKTIREVAEDFNISKSTVHKDLKERLPLIDKDLYKIVDEKLNDHLASRHIRGGESTRLKYKG